MISMIPAKRAALLTAMALVAVTDRAIMASEPKAASTNAAPQRRVHSLDEEIHRITSLDVDFASRYPDIKGANADRLLAGLRTNPFPREPGPREAARNNKPGLRGTDELEPRELGVRRRWKLARSTAPQSINEALFQSQSANRIEILSIVFVKLQAAQQKADIAADSLAGWERLLTAVAARAEKGASAKDEGSSRPAGAQNLRMAIDAFRETRGLRRAAEEHLNLVRLEHLVAQERLSVAKVELERLQELRAATFHIPLRDRQQIEVESLENAPRLAPPALAELKRLGSEVRPSLLVHRVAFKRLERQLGPLEENHLDARPAEAAADPLFDEFAGVGANAQGRINVSRGPNGLIVRQIDIGNERARSQLESVRQTLEAYQEQMVSEVEESHRDCSGKLTALLDAEKLAFSARQTLERAEQAANADVDLLVTLRRAQDSQRILYLNALIEYRLSCLKLNAAVGQRIFP